MGNAGSSDVGGVMPIAPGCVCVYVSGVCVCMHMRLIGPVSMPTSLHR